MDSEISENKNFLIEFGFCIKKIKFGARAFFNKLFSLLESEIVSVYREGIKLSVILIFITDGNNLDILSVLSLSLTEVSITK